MASTVLFEPAPAITGTRPLAALTTSFCVDFLDLERSKRPDHEQTRIRRWVHLGMSAMLFLVILGFSSIHNQAVITKLFEVAGYTYGPILGLFAFGLLTSRQVNDRLVLPLAILSPLLTWMVNTWSDTLLAGFKLGFLVIAVNGILMFIGLLFISRRTSKTDTVVFQ